MDSPQIVCLSDNEPISPLEYARAALLRRRIAQAVYDRDRYVERHNLDRWFCHPDANWSRTKDFFDAYRHIRYGHRNVIERLRFVCAAFTGFSLQMMRMSEGMRSVNPLPDDFDERLRALPVDPWVECWTNHTRNIADDALFRPPARLGEIGWKVRDVIVNHDTYHCQERVNLLLDNGVIDRLRGIARPRILEIGGGYGALALALRQIVGGDYVICDLPESLLFSGLYLSLAARERVALWPKTAPITLVPNYRFDEIAGPFDLIINTLSMAEMSEYQVRYYASRIRSLLAEGAQFFEQNTDNSAIGLLNVKDILPDYLDGVHIDSVNSAKVRGVAHLWR